MNNGFWTKKRVLVTGANGFIGSHIVDALVAQNSIVTAIVHATKTKNPPLNLEQSKNRIRILPADLQDAQQCAAICKDQDIILHFAVLDGGFEYKTSHAKDIYEANTTMTKYVLHAAETNAVKQVLIVSTIDVYATSSLSPLIETDVALQNYNTTPYGYVRAKQEIELLAQRYAQKNRMSISIARLGNVYGPRDSPIRGRVIPRFISLAMQGMPISLYTHGLQQRSFLYIEDAVPALLRLPEITGNAEPINIASSEYISIATLAEMIRNTTGKQVKITQDVDQQIKNINRIISIAKAQKILGFQQKFNLQEGLQRTIDVWSPSFRLLS